MSQQLQQPPSTQTGVQTSQPQYQAQTSAGQQFQQSPLGQVIGQRYQDSVPVEIQQAVSDLDWFETAMEFAKSRAVERGQPRIASRCDDLAEIAHMEKKLLLRQSPFAQPIGQATQQTIQQGVQELQHRAGDPEVQEALSQSQQVLGTIQQALGQLQTWGQQGVQQPQQSY